MIEMNVNTAQEALTKKQLKELGANAKKALADANNRAAAGMRTDGTRLIVKNSGLKRPLVFPAFKIIKASPKVENPQAKLLIKGPVIPLINNASRSAKPAKGKKKGGITVNLGKSKETFKNAFIAKMPSGHIGIFERQRGKLNSKGREAIKELFGPSVPQIADREEIVSEVSEKAQERFLKRFEQQFNRFTRS